MSYLPEPAYGMAHSFDFGRSTRLLDISDVELVLRLEKSM
jgi:hypothetical protein